MKSKAAILTGPNESLIIDDLILPNPQPDQVILKMISTGICLSQIH